MIVFRPSVARCCREMLQALGTAEALAKVWEMEVAGRSIGWRSWVQTGPVAVGIGSPVPTITYAEVLEGVSWLRVRLEDVSIAKEAYSIIILNGEQKGRVKKSIEKEHHIQRRSSTAWKDRQKESKTPSSPTNTAVDELQSPEPSFPRWRY